MVKLVVGDFKQTLVYRDSLRLGSKRRSEVYRSHCLLISTIEVMSQKNGVIPNLPTNDLSLNVFLYKISKNISDEELNSLKFMCTGTHDGIPKREQEKIGNAQDLFLKLRELQVITRENLLTLQALIWHIGRKDLYQDFVEFCDKTDKTLHFFEDPPSEHDDNKTLWRFHVRGHNTKGNLDYLNELRDAVSRILCCPREKIFVRGVEESQSIFVFFAIPKMCNDVLKNLSNTKRNQLLLFGVDDIKKVEYITKPSQSQPTLSGNTISVSVKSRTNSDPVNTRINDDGQENIETSAGLQKPEFVRQTSRRDAMIRLSGGSEHPELDSFYKKRERFQRKIESGSQASRHGIHLTSKPSFGKFEREELVRIRKQYLDTELPPIMSDRTQHDISDSRDHDISREQQRNKRGQADSGFAEHVQDEN